MSTVPYTDLSDDKPDVALPDIAIIFAQRERWRPTVDRDGKPHVVEGWLTRLPNAESGAVSFCESLEAVMAYVARIPIGLESATVVVDPLYVKVAALEAELSRHGYRFGTHSMTD